MTIETEPLAMTGSVENAVRTASHPTALRITDIRVATVVGHGYYPILKIDTNQGVYGLGARLSEAGVRLAADICAAVRAAVGDDVSLCTDHFAEGFVTADEAIRIGQALEPYNLAWIEDVMPWTDIASHKKVADALLTPVAAGEDLYLWEGFREAIETRAFDIIHPDMLSSGGLLETKRIADHAERFGIPTALHACCSPVGFMANIHLGAAVASLVAVEHHGLDLPFFTRLVNGMADDYMADGYVTVPEAPGLGIDLNEQVIREHLREGAEYFGDSSEWNRRRVGFDRVPHD